MLLWSISISQSLRSWTVVTLQLMDGWTARWQFTLLQFVRPLPELILPTSKDFPVPVHFFWSRLTPVCCMLYVPQLGLSSPACPISSVHTGSRMCSRTYSLNTDAVLKGYTHNHLDYKEHVWSYRENTNLECTFLSFPNSLQKPTGRGYILKC